MNIGIAELFVILAIFSVVPVAAVIWALSTLHRIRAGQLAAQMKLDMIERLLQRP
ncbi:MAG: hypothetical protein ACHQKY_14555 [Terriglobia bacterium]